MHHAPSIARFAPTVAWCLCVAVTAAAAPPSAEPAFRVRPYLQNPAPDAMTVRWLSESGEPGRLSCDGRTFASRPVLATELSYHTAEPVDLQHPSPPFLHTVRITGLEPATSYPYEVEQAGETSRAVLTTSPLPGTVGRGGAVRLFFYGDSECEPESRGAAGVWPPSPSGGSRPPWVEHYPVDQSTGYRMNLALIAARAAESLRDGNPALVNIVGDLVQSGGEQRDWDEFWRHNAGVFGSLACRVPLVAAFGNHDIFGGPTADEPARDLGGYSGPASLFASQKLLTYFEHPENGATDERHVGRYHRVDFGPVTLLTLDSTNGGADGSASDTNHLLDRRTAPYVPDYMPGSEQHAWLVRELAAARDRGAITFVQFHHAPFSSGPHGRAPGRGPRQDLQSGQPLRFLVGLLREHGVRAVFSGHDEMYEHSVVDGVHFYDVGIGGDDLRAPVGGLFNDRQVFCADIHAPERWDGDVLVSGGKHYGHVEVDVTRRPDAEGFRVTITPVHVFPLLAADAPGEVTGWERRQYDDVVVFDVPAPIAAEAVAP
jgi:hypothetical protein